MDQNRTPFWDETSPTAPARPFPQAQYRWEESKTKMTREIEFENYPRSGHRTSAARGEESRQNFNFSTAHAEEDDLYHKKKMSRDPMSHRIIEKRRRDRMNNCLADLSRLIPAEYLKKGRGRVEKTEIIEMAIKHLQHLQQTANHNFAAFPTTAPPSESPTAVESFNSSIGAGTNPSAPCAQNGQPNGTGNAPTAVGSTNCATTGAGVTNGTCPNGATSANSNYNSGGSSNAGWEAETSEVSYTSTEASQDPGNGVRPIVTEHYRLGYQECLSEAMHFLVEVEGFFACDALCVRLISHLQRHCDRVVKDDRLNVPRSRKPGETSSSSGSSTSGVCSSSNCTSAAAAPPPAEVGDLNDSPLPTPAAHSYKFKNTIKQRFSDDQQERRHKRRRIKSTSPSPSGSRSPSPTTKCSPSPRLEVLTVPHNESAPVPIFVLHSTGSFYVPLTVTYDVLAPYLERLDTSGPPMDAVQSSPRAATPSRPTSVLHPVTISVNFSQCPSEKVNPIAGQLALPLPPQSPGNFGLPPTCCPMPAWGSYGGNS